MDEFDTELKYVESTKPMLSMRIITVRFFVTFFFQKRVMCHTTLKYSTSPEFRLSAPWHTLTYLTFLSASHMAAGSSSWLASIRRTYTSALVDTPRP